MLTNLSYCTEHLREFGRFQHGRSGEPGGKAITSFDICATSDEVDNMFETPHDYRSELFLQLIAERIPDKEFQQWVRKRVPIVVMVDEKAAISARFEKLNDQWKRDTLFYSSVTDICMHPSYQQIIGMGQRALPYIFRELRRELGHWFWALNAITGDDPVQPGHEGYMERIAADWLEYGKRHDWLS